MPDKEGKHVGFIDNRTSSSTTEHWIYRLRSPTSRSVVEDWAWHAWMKDFDKWTFLYRSRLVYVLLLQMEWDEEQRRKLHPVVFSPLQRGVQSLKDRVSIGVM